jgi:hypothetical protein
LFEAFQKEFTDVLVPLRELSGDFLQEETDPVVRERHDPGNDPAHPLGVPRIKGPQKNT